MSPGEGSERTIAGVAPAVSSVKLRALCAPGQVRFPASSRRCSSGSNTSDCEWVQPSRLVFLLPVGFMERFLPDERYGCMASLTQKQSEKAINTLKF